MIGKTLTRRDLLVAAVGALILGIWFLGQLLALSTDPTLRSRFERTERLGSERSAGLRVNDIAKSNTAELSAKQHHSSSATWRMSAYEFAHDLPRSVNCSMSIYVLGHFIGLSRSAYGEVLLNRSPVAILRDNGSQTDPARWGFADAKPRPIRMTPLYQPTGITFPISAAGKGCALSQWDITLRAHDALWHVERVGIEAHYTPRTPQGRDRFLWLAIAAFELIALEAGALLLMAAICNRFGILAVAACVIVMIGATVTHDQWDFPVWPRFIDLAAYGHGYPVQMWNGTPLWPILVTALAPLAAAGSFFEVLGTQEATGIWLKISLALAYCATAYALATWPSSITSRHRFFVALLAPFGLYELAAGYREIVAGAFLLLGFELAWRERYVAGSLAIAAASSISEAVAPALVFPAAISLIRNAPLRPSDFLRALAFAAVACLTIALQWLFLIPHATATAAVSARIDAYRYGGGSWLSVLDAFGRVPDWVPRHGLYLFFGVFALFAIAPVSVTVKAILSGGDLELRKQRVLGASVALIAAFMLAYRGIDPNNWYGFFVVVGYAVSRVQVANPLPLLLSLSGAATFYAIGGIGDFVDWWFLKPLDQGQLGILGLPVAVAVATTTALILCAYIGGCTGRWEYCASGKLAPWSVVLWAFCGLAASIQSLAADLVLLGAFVALVVLSLHFSGPSGRTPNARGALRFGALLAVIALVGLAVRSQSAGAALALLPGLLLYAIETPGLGDLVLLASGAGLILLQPGNGLASGAGYDALLAMTAISVGRIAWRLSRSVV